MRGQKFSHLPGFYTEIKSRNHGHQHEQERRRHCGDQFSRHARQFCAERARKRGKHFPHHRIELFAEHFIFLPDLGAAEQPHARRDFAEPVKGFSALRALCALSAPGIIPLCKERGEQLLQFPDSARHAGGNARNKKPECQHQKQDSPHLARDARFSRQRVRRGGDRQRQPPCKHERQQHAEQKPRAQQRRRHTCRRTDHHGGARFPFSFHLSLRAVRFFRFSSVLFYPPRL